MHAWFFEQIGQRAPAAAPRRRQRLVLLLAQLDRAGGDPPQPAADALARWCDTHDASRASTRRPFGTASRSSSASGARTCSPRYRAAVQEAEARVETLPVTELPALIDELAGLPARPSGGSRPWPAPAYKMEMNLAAVLSDATCAARSAAATCRLLTGFERHREDRRACGRVARLVASQRRDRIGDAPIADHARGWLRPGTRPRRPPSPRSPRRRAACRPSDACSPMRSTSSRFARSRSAS